MKLKQLIQLAKEIYYDTPPLSLDDAIFMSLSRHLPEDIGAFCNTTKISPIVSTICDYAKLLRLASYCIERKSKMQKLIRIKSNEVMICDFYFSDFSLAVCEKKQQFISAAQLFLDHYRRLEQKGDAMDDIEVILYRQFQPVYFNLGLLATEVLALKEVMHE